MTCPLRDENRFCVDCPVEKIVTDLRAQLAEAETKVDELSGKLRLEEGVSHSVTKQRDALASELQRYVEWSVADFIAPVGTEESK